MNSRMGHEKTKQIRQESGTLDSKSRENFSWNDNKLTRTKVTERAYIHRELIMRTRHS